MPQTLWLEDNLNEVITGWRWVVWVRLKLLIAKSASVLHSFSTKITLIASTFNDSKSRSPNLECAGRAKRRRRFGFFLGFSSEVVNSKRCRAALATALQ